MSASMKLHSVVPLAVGAVAAISLVSLVACVPTSGEVNKGLSSSYDTSHLIDTTHSSFRVSDIRVENNGKSSKVATGKITNTGTTTKSFVYLKVSFLDSDLNVIAVEGTYAVGKEGLSPGESTTWKVHTDYDYKIKSARAEVVDNN